MSNGLPHLCGTPPSPNSNTFSKAFMKSFSEWTANEEDSNMRFFSFNLCSPVRFWREKKHAEVSYYHKWDEYILNKPFENYFVFDYTRLKSSGVINFFGRIIFILQECLVCPKSSVTERERLYPSFCDYKQHYYPT